MSELALYETAREALATAVRIDEVVDIYDQARRAQAYAKIARDRRLVADAQELIARAERKLGILIRKVKNEGLLSTGGRPSNSNLGEPETGAEAEPVFDSTSFTLADLGISKKLSSRAQALADLGDDDFEETVFDAREKTLATDAAVVSPKRAKVVAAPKPAKPLALEPRRFHQFVVSLLAISFSSDRVSSIGIWELARTTGIVEGADDDLEFTAEAYEALGALAETALRPFVLAAERAPDRGPAMAPKETASDEGESNSCPSALGHTSSDNRDGALAAGLGTTPCEDGASPAPLPSFRHSKHTAEPILRARYENEPADALAAELGVPVNTLRTWAFRLGLTSKQRISAMATERNTRRAAE